MFLFDILVVVVVVIAHKMECVCIIYTRKKNFFSINSVQRALISIIVVVV